MLRWIENGSAAYIMFFIFLLGIAANIVMALFYTNLIKETENMSSTKKKLLKQIKLKFESCYRLNLDVNNVEVFIDKYIYRYKICGMNLNTMNHIVDLPALFCVMIGVGSGIIGILYESKMDLIVSYVSAGTFLAIFLVILSQMADIDMKRQILVTNIQDYLENTLLNRLTGDTTPTPVEKAEEIEQVEQMSIQSVPDVQPVKKPVFSIKKEEEQIIEEILKEFLS